MEEQPSQYPKNYQPQPQYSQYPPQQQPPYYPPPPQKKSHKGLWITLAIIFAVLLFSCIGISVAITNSAKGVITNAIATTDTNSTTTSSSTIAKVGQTITLDGVQATLTSVKTHAGTDFDKTKAGNEYVIVCPTLAIVLDEVVVLFVSVVAIAFVTTPFALLVIATLIPIQENSKTAAMIASVIHSPLCDFFCGGGG